MQPQIDHRLRRIRERPRAPHDVHRAAVDDHLQQRLDINIDIGRQVRDERNAELDMLDVMLLGEHLIIEANVAVSEPDVGDRETLWFAGRLFFRLRGRRIRRLEQVGKIEALLGTRE